MGKNQWDDKNIDMNFDPEKLNFTSFRRQRCNICHCEDKSNFNVSDRLWRQIVALELQSTVICLPCFDELAREQNVDDADSIDVLYFAGQASIKPNRAGAKPWERLISPSL